MQNSHWLIIFSLLFTACASNSVFDASQVDGAITPTSVIANPVDSRGKLALWGGTILDVQNLKDATQIELLAYPLGSSQRPQQNEKPLGRFLVLQPGFLEPTVYTLGKLLTVFGEVGDNQQGQVGETSYSYPVILAQKIHLWSPKDASRTQFSFGIGIVF